MRGLETIRRVLMTADTVGGVWTYAMELVRGLAQWGVEVSLATMGAPLSPEQRRAAVAIPSLDVHESRYKLEWMDDPWRDVERAGDWLLTLESKIAPDIVHLNGYAHGSLPWRAPSVVVGHSCVLSWWSAVKGEIAPSEWGRYRSVVTSGLRSAGAVVAPTRAMLSELLRFYGPFEACAVIPNARGSAVRSAVRKEPFILAAGRLWDEAKNIAAIARVQRATDWPIWVAGDTAHPNGNAPRLRGIKLLGLLSQRELGEYYSRASIYCLPAKYEPFGLSILEAAQAECALVIGDIPSLRENWDGAALFVPPDDTYALEQALRSFTSSDEYRSAMGRIAAQRAAAFTLGGMCRRYMNVYAGLAEKRPIWAAAGD